MLDELGIVLFVFNAPLHASLYLYELKFEPSFVSFYRLYVENDPQESIFFERENDEKQIFQNRLGTRQVVSEKAWDDL